MITARFIGGPLHGKRKDLPEPRDRYQVPAYAGFPEMLLGGIGAEPNIVEVHVYRVLDEGEGNAVIMMYIGKQK